MAKIHRTTEKELI